MANRFVSVNENYQFPTPLEARLAALFANKEATETALGTKADGATMVSQLAGKADLVAGKVPLDQLPTSSLVTDSNVAAVVNGAQTGPAIDSRINAQVTPQVEQIAADYIASQPAVVDAAAAAVDANPTINTLQSQAWYRGGVPIGADLSTLTVPGYYIVSAATTAASITPALPAGFANIGFVELLSATSNTYRAYRWSNIAGSTRGVFQIEYQNGAWTAWRQLDAPVIAPPPAKTQAEERQVRIDQARQRAGGKIGTDGLPTVVLRFDDWADDMEAKVMPRLRARNLPACWAATVDYIEDPAKGVQTWSTVSQWVRDGIELLGHSWTHNNASGLSAIQHEVIESADYIEGQVPAAAIDTWVMPGTGAGAATYGGFGIGDIVQNYYSTDAGRMLLQRYPIICGAVPGRHMPLVGTQAIGQTHTTFENDTAASAIAKLQSAMDAGAGITMMAHPVHLGGAVGKMTLADFDTFLDWIVAERDAGRLLVLTARGQAFADASVSRRLNLFKNANFKNGLTGWGGTTGYTLGTDGDRAYATTATALQLEQTFDMASYGYLRGGVVELSALVRVVGADAEVRTALTGTASTRTITAAEGWRRVSHVATISKNLDVSATLTGFVGRASGGEVQVAETAICPV